MSSPARRRPVGTDDGGPRADLAERLEVWAERHSPAPNFEWSMQAEEQLQADLREAASLLRSTPEAEAARTVRADEPASPLLALAEGLEARADQHQEADPVWATGMRFAARLARDHATREENKVEAMQTQALGWLAAALANRANAWDGHAPKWFPEPPEWLTLWDQALEATREENSDG